MTPTHSYLPSRKLNNIYLTLAGCKASATQSLPYHFTKDAVCGTMPCSHALLAFTTNSSKSFGTSSLGGKCAVSYRIKSGKSKIKGISTQMKDVIKTGVQIVHILSFCGTLLCGVLGVVYAIIGPVKYKQLLSSFGISNGFERTWLWAVMMLILLLSTHFIKAKLLSK